MWYFEAFYINMDDETESRRTIKFDGQFFNNEEEIYIYAMTKAYEVGSDFLNIAHWLLNEAENKTDR